jgi:hypothetical protein
VAGIGVRRGAYRVFMGKREGKRPLGRPRRMWEGIIKTDFQEVEWGGGMKWTDVTQNRDRWRAFVRGGNKPSGSIKWGVGRGFLD